MALLVHPGAGWSIRRARQSDRARVEEIFRVCLRNFHWRGPVQDEVIRMRRTLLAAEMLVAEAGQAGVVGFLTLEELNAYVPHLFVDPDWRLCGVGSGLLDVARSLCGRPLRLDVDRQNRAALAAYLASGWTEHEAVAKSGASNDQIRLVGP